MSHLVPLCQFSLDRNTQINAQNSQHIATLSNSIATLSNDLITIASNAKFNDRIKKQVCDVSLVYKTSQLKNDHVTFKTDNFQKLGTYGHWRVKQCSECEMGRWIQQCEMENLRFVHTKDWRELKEIHSKVHSGVQTYIDKNNQKVSNSELRIVAAQIERSTLALFDKLNDVKVINCELQY